MSTWKLQRQLYLFQRALGDVDAARRGTLPTRVARRVMHRKLIGLLRRGGLW